MAATISFKYEAEKIETLKNAAKDEGRTLSSLVQKILTDNVKKVKKVKKESK